MPEIAFPTDLIKRSWTNDEVVALGAVKQGYFKVATIPPRTIVRNVFIVIDTKATVLIQLYVMMGRELAEGFYYDYILPQEPGALSEPNTLIGSLLADLGINMLPNLSGPELPSLTDPTDVYLGFFTTDEDHDLEDVLTCNGTIYILTDTLH